jgi:hypothetical protein
MTMGKKKSKRQDHDAIMTWTPTRVRALGMTTDVAAAAQIIGIGRTLAYDLVKHDSFPVPYCG